MPATATSLKINGKDMPFTAEELVKVLKTIKRAFAQASEELFQDDEKEVMDDLINELNNL